MEVQILKSLMQKNYFIPYIKQMALTIQNLKRLSILFLLMKSPQI